MSTILNSTAFNRGVDPVLRLFPEELARNIVRYRGDAALQNRIEELAERSNEGELSVDEQAEYEGYVQANKFVAILQAKARKLISSSGS